MVNYIKNHKIKNSVVAKAIKEALSSTVCRGKVGAVLFTDCGRIITSAHNACFYGHIEEDKFTVHAEEYCIAKFLKIKGNKRFAKSGKLNLLVVRYRPVSNSLAIAKPCPKCEFLLEKANLNVYYTNDNSEIVAL